MPKKSAPAKMVFILILVLLTACAGGGVPVSGPAPLKVEWTLWQGDYTLLVADKMGFFKKHGLNVVPVKYDSSSAAIPDLAGAKIDGGLFTMSDVILATTMMNLQAVMVSDNGGAYTIVGSPDIQNLRGLRGKRIGLNLHTSSEMFVTYMLKSVAMTPGDVTFVEMSPDQVASSIPATIDAGLVWEPYTSQALSHGTRIVFQSSTYSTLVPKMIAFRTAITENRPADVRAFLSAWNEAVDYRILHPQESTQIIADATGLPASELPLSSNISIYSIDNNNQLFANQHATDTSSIYFIAQFNSDFLVQTGYITDPPDVNALLNPSFLK